MLIALLIILGVAILAYGFALVRAAIAKRVAPGVEALALGAVVNFLDTLGIGSFAPTTAWFKFRRMVPDRLIPPTLLVGLTPPAMAESIIYLILLGVLVDPVLLFGCATAVLAGGLVGARLVARARIERARRAWRHWCRRCWSGREQAKQSMYYGPRPLPKI